MCLKYSNDAMVSKNTGARTGFESIDVLFVLLVVGHQSFASEGISFLTLTKSLVGL